MLLLLILLNLLFLCMGGYVIINRQLPQLNRGIKAVAAILVVFTLVAYAFYLSLIFSMGIWVLAGALTAVNIFLAVRNRGVYKSAFFKGQCPADNRHVVFPLFIILLFTAYFFIYAKRWGDWDAIAIWNMHAKFLYDAGSWRSLFSGIIPWSHTDYPLLLPSLTALFWQSAGNVTPFIPAIISWFPLVLIPLLCYCALYRADHNWFAMAAMAVFVIDNRFITIACSQCADALLALFILLAVVLYTRLKTNQGAIYIMAFTAGAATWVKNEGILFFVVFTLIFVACNYRNRRWLQQYLWGAILPLAVLLSFKLLYSPANDLVAGNVHNGPGIVQKLLDVSRYITIAKFMASTLFYRYIDMAILLLAVLLFSPRFFLSSPFVLVLLVIAGYFLIYLTTPHDLTWHLNTSADRVLMHVYPALVYAAAASLQASVTDKAKV